MHLGRGAFEKAPTAANEQRVTCENCFVGPVLEEETHAVLCVAGCVQSGHRDGTDVEGLLVRWGLGHTGAIAAANDGEGVVLELQKVNRRFVDGMGDTCDFLITACMVMVAVDV